jgi:hypothetical protein
MSSFFTSDVGINIAAGNDAVGKKTKTKKNVFWGKKSLARLLLRQFFEQ